MTKSNSNILFTILLGYILLACNPPKQPSFLMTVPKEVASGPLTGRLFLFLNPDTVKVPIESVGWFDDAPFFATDVRVWKPGEPFIFHKRPLGYPIRFDSLKSGRYVVQAVLDIGQTERHFIRAPGNLYSKPMVIDLRVGDDSQEIPIVLDQVFAEQPFASFEGNDSPSIKEVVFESRLLSEFWGRPTPIKAAVILPASYEQSADNRYPALYIIPGFGGRYYGAARMRERFLPAGATDKVLVLLDPETYWGHHVFADSENNGPWGKALTEELIPYLETTFRLIPDSRARLLTGHSSGGWSSLWLQVTYPEVFGGVWSTSPDPVDFRDFQRINLYEDANMFVSADNAKRPLARRNGQPTLYYKAFSDMEEVMGHGGQLGSFEAAFSPKGPDGKPVRLWDRQTGAINRAVAEHWKKYDISLILREKWPMLGPQLSGKIRVYMGEDDTYYLEGATRLLKQELEKLGSDAVIELFPGRDHGLLRDQAIVDRMVQEMDSSLQAKLPK